MAPDVPSLGHQTDLMVLRLAGSEITEQGSLTLVRTPDNPAYRWGNFVLHDDTTAGSVWSEAVDLFREAFPSETTIRLGIASSPPAVVLPGWIARLELEGDAALASAAAPSAPVPDGITLRALEDDDDWAASLELQRLNNGYTDDDDLVFLTRQVASLRGAVERGGGRWFGAFAGGALVGGLGVFSDGAGGSGDARFQSVDVLAAWRGRGTASALLSAAGRWALEEAGARRLVIVAERGSAALRLYRRLGMDADGAELQWRLSGPVTAVGPPDAAERRTP